MSDIYWLIAAQRRFREAMPPSLTSAECTQDFEQVCQRLAATFPKASAVIVRDRFHGYQNYRYRHILLVEVVHRSKSVEGSQISWPDFCESQIGRATNTTAHVVKIAFDPSA